VPDGVPVQQPALGGAGVPGDGLGDPDFQPGQLFVAGGRVLVATRIAQVPQRLAVGELVEGGMGEGRSPVTSWRSTAESLLLSSQLSTVPGRPAPARLSRSARSEDRRPRRSGPGPRRVIRALRLIRS
jgi:hypothetical protein